jgi:hypothetical protein
VLCEQTARKLLGPEERLVGMSKASARLRLDTSVSVFDMAIAVVW